MKKMDIERDQENIGESTLEEKYQVINEKGNIEESTITKYYLSYNDSVKGIDSIISKEYLYLEWIDNDTYIFGELSASLPAGWELTGDIDSNIRYGILRLQRDEKGNIIPKGEKVMVQAIYEDISQNNCKTVTAKTQYGYTYFDYEKGFQLVPGILKHAVPFDTEYEGFAECSINENEVGFLPRNAEPVTKVENIILFTEKEVQALTCKYYDDMIAADEKMKRSTGSTYSYYKAMKK